MKRACRVTAPRVIDGRVQRKNNWRRTPDYWNTPQVMPVIDRQAPGPRHRHVLFQRDVERFIALLPDWAELSRGLNAVVLSPKDSDCDGWYKPGVVALCAWPRGLWEEWSAGGYANHRQLLDRLGVPCEPLSDRWVLCQFTEATVRAYQLLHVFLHELGHHHDRMTTRSRKECARGEEYAEEYAFRYEAIIWDRYLNEFELY